MATVKELKATTRPAGGKGAARAERRAGRVPGVIYGNNQPPVTISVNDAELRQRILAGRFLTTIYDIDLEGKKHRVIPRDFSLDPVRDFPLHVDFLRLGQGSKIRVSVPLHVLNAETGEVLFKEGEKVSPRAARKAQNDGVSTLLVPMDEIIGRFAALMRAMAPASSFSSGRRRRGAQIFSSNRCSGQSKASACTS